MKRCRIVLVLSTIAVVLLAVALCRLWPRSEPTEGRCEVYDRYCGDRAIQVSYLTDYPVNDTLSVAATVLEARSYSDWLQMLEVFNVPKELVRDVPSGVDVCVWQSLKGSPEEKYNSVMADEAEEAVVELVSMSFRNREICVFHTQNEQEYDAVFDKRITANL